VAPDGLNINRECGALAPEQMRREVLARRADIGWSPRHWKLRY